MSSFSLFVITVIILVITLAGCASDQNPDNGSSSPGIVDTMDPEESIVDTPDPTRLYREQGIQDASSEIASHSLTFEDAHPDITRAKEEYDTLIAGAATILGTDAPSAQREFMRYLSTFLLYSDALVSHGTGVSISEDPLITRYQDFLIENLANDGVTVTRASLDLLVSTIDLTRLDTLIRTLDPYMLPDGSLVDPELKTTFEQFRAGGENAGMWTITGDPLTDEQTAFDQFKVHMYTLDLAYDGHCDQIPDSIDTSSLCPYYGSDESTN